MPGVDARYAGIVPAFLLLGTLAPPAPAQEGGPPVVVARSVEREVVEQVPVSGTLISPRVAQLSPGVAGLVDKVDVEAGDRVTAGAPLLHLDADLARLELDAARARTEQARAQLADARRRLADAERLARDSGIAQTEVRARETDVRIAAAAVQLRESEQRSADERLRRHELTAPFAGVIGRKMTESGEWVTPGTAVVELIAIDGLRIDFRVPQGYFPRISAATELEIRLDALPERRFAGRIGEIVPVSDTSARTFVIRAYLDDPSLPLTPGMSASAVLRLDTGRRQVVVTRDALLRHPDGRVTVWVVDDSGERPRVRERVVRTGLAFDGLVAITEGLEVGVRVVVEGNEALRGDPFIKIVAER